MENEFEPGSDFHTIWIYKETFYKYGMFTESDLEMSLDDLKYMADKWNRVTSINVLPELTIGSRINNEMGKHHLKPSTKRFTVGSEKEGLELIKLYDLQKKDR